MKGKTADLVTNKCKREKILFKLKVYLLFTNAKMQVNINFIVIYQKGEEK